MLVKIIPNALNLRFSVSPSTGIYNNKIIPMKNIYEKNVCNA